MRNGHLATIYPALVRRITLPSPYERERIPTPDDDFLDLDWIRAGRERLVIISHGLEGNSERAYIQGMAHAFWSCGFDVLAWNYRSCGTEMNRSLTMYHSGATADLACVVDHAIRQGYGSIQLVGFSLGGNLTLKYLGEKARPQEIKKAVVFSVPLDLSAGSDHISRRENRIYERRFLRSLKRKVIAKKVQFPSLDTTRLDEIQTLRAFDDRFTAPLHGFVDAEDYYQQCSSRYFLKSINRPALVVNAANDPFLPTACLDPGLFEDAPFASFEKPALGGHCGFASFKNKPWYWSEQRALAYCLTDE
ncbi:MAG: alpha/beta fold hydrolase [Bacteroidota bacterium]